MHEDMRRTVGYPKGYTRSDESICEDLCKRLAFSNDVDARDVEVSVDAGIVKLTGSVPDRRQKRWIEELAARVSGVRDVTNHLRETAQDGSGAMPGAHISGVSQGSPATGSSASSYGGGLERGNSREFPKGRDPYGGTTNPMKSVT